MSFVDSAATIQGLSEQLRGTEQSSNNDNRGEGKQDQLNETEREEYLTSFEEQQLVAQGKAELLSESADLEFIEAEEGSGSALISVLSWIVAAMSVAVLVWFVLTQFYFEALLTALIGFFAVCLLQVSAHVVRLQEQQRWVLLQLLALQRRNSSTASSSAHAPQQRETSAH